MRRVTCGDCKTVIAAVDWSAPIDRRTYDEIVACCIVHARQTGHVGSYVIESNLSTFRVEGVVVR